MLTSRRGNCHRTYGFIKDPQRPSYPTQKNAAMLERIILTSSEPEDTVLDCYAGSGTTLLEAARLGRRFVGMDDAAAAWEVAGRRLRAEGVEWGEISSSVVAVK